MGWRTKAVTALALGGMVMAALTMATPEAGASKQRHAQAIARCGKAATSYEVITKAETKACSQGGFEQRNVCPDGKSFIIVEPGSGSNSYALRVGVRPVKLPLSFTAADIYQVCPVTTQTTTTTVPPTTTTTVAPTTTTTAGPPGVGTSLTLTKTLIPWATVQLVAFVDPASASNAYERPNPATYEFVAAEFTVTDISKTTPVTEDVYLDAKIYDSAGQGFEGDFYTPTNGPTFPSGKIDVAPGGSATGWIMFSVPPNSPPFRLTFTPVAGRATQAALTWTAG